MADNPEFVDTVENAAHELIGNLITKQDWEEEEKERLQKEYMTVRTFVLFICVGNDLVAVCKRLYVSD